mmetsp:Transcript_25030/g.63903  ORF Transcript_25030/g.63903 Transcript_25030/m.63903 type:complete len:301 (-) Transcript_25030:598-1500(-)
MGLMGRSLGRKAKTFWYSPGRKPSALGCSPGRRVWALRCRTCRSPKMMQYSPRRRTTPAGPTTQATIAKLRPHSLPNQTPSWQGHHPLRAPSPIPVRMARVRKTPPTPRPAKPRLSPSPQCRHGRTPPAQHLCSATSGLPARPGWRLGGVRRAPSGRRGRRRRTWISRGWVGATHCLCCRMLVLLWTTLREVEGFERYCLPPGSSACPPRRVSAGRRETLSSLRRFSSRDCRYARPTHRVSTRLWGTLFVRGRFAVQRRARTCRGRADGGGRLAVTKRWPGVIRELGRKLLKERPTAWHN